MRKFFKNFTGFLLITVIVWVLSMFMITAGVILLVGAPIVGAWSALDEHECDYDDEDDSEVKDDAKSCLFRDFYNADGEGDYCDHCEYRDICNWDFHE